jgi:CubicO group peptidase (beta-lactamase class C family)
MRKPLLFFLLISLIGLGSCSDDPLNDLKIQDQENPEVDSSDVSTGYYFPPNSGSEWQTINIDSLKWNSDNLQALLDFAKEKRTYGLIILYKGKIVTENYWNDWSEKTPMEIASAGKSITAFLIGLAQQENLLNINDPTSTYLGTGWSSMSAGKEKLITVRHHLSMTTGIDDRDDNCVAASCLRYRIDAGKRWSYNNVPYFLLHHILEKASGSSFDEFTKTRLADKIGLQNWKWDNYMLSLNTRDMARFGLLILAGGKWRNEQIMSDSTYLKAMLSTSSNLNRSYGYLWWLNGQPSYVAPGEGVAHQGSLIPDAPKDMVSAMGRGDKKIYVVPSMDLVIVRQGEDTGESVFGPSSFDNDLWKKIKAVIPSEEVNP